MSNLWYSFRELRNSFIFKAIILIQITMAIILLYKVNEIKNYENAKLNLMKAITEDKVIYSMMSKYKSLDDFSKDSEDPNKFLKFYNDIQNKYDLVVVTYGGILAKDFKNIDQFLDSELHKYDEGEYKSINSLQCNSNFFETFNINLSQGNLNEFNNFNKLSYKDMEGKIIPIILGDSYKEIFKLNDIIEDKFMTYRVEGFLEKNQFYLDKGIYDPTRAKNLNTFAITPIAYDISISNLNNALLINKNMNADFYSIQKEIDELAKEYDVKLSITNPKENIDFFIEIINYDANIKKVIVYIVIFFVIIGLLAIFSNRINARRKEFSLHIMHGATYSDIYIRVLLEHLYLFVLSIAISSYFLIKTKTKIITDIINFDLGAFAQSTLIIFLIVIIVVLVPIYNINRNRLNYLIKGE